MIVHRRSQILIWVRGAGELASACALSLRRCGFRVCMSDLAKPLAIRRSVCFCEALREGSMEVEGIVARAAERSEATALLDGGLIPVLQDREEALLGLDPYCVVDARMLKDPDAARIGPAEQRLIDRVEFSVGLGPGFLAGGDCHAVIETRRGARLGRIIREGPASSDTGVPGELGGESRRRVVYARVPGTLEWVQRIGELVKQGNLLGRIHGEQAAENEIRAPLDGIVRGLLHPEVPVRPGLKIADVDPRGARVNCAEVADKAMAVGRAVLEALMQHLAAARR